MDVRDFCTILFERSFDQSATVFLKVPLVRQKPELPDNWDSDTEFKQAIEDIVHAQLSKWHNEGKSTFSESDEVLLKQYLEYLYMKNSYEYWKSLTDIEWWLNDNHKYRGAGHSAQRNCILKVFGLLGYVHIDEDRKELEGWNHEIFTKNGESTVFLSDYYLNSAKATDVSSERLKCNVILLDVQHQVEGRPKRHGFKSIISDSEQSQYGDYWVTYYDLIDMINSIPEAKVTEFSV